MSWFQDLSSLTASVQATVGSSLPTSLPSATDMLESLTLTTPELAAERRRIDSEEKRKLHVRDALAGLFPWETRDAEREILVEECRDAILKLSSQKETFFGPFHMPKLNAKIDDDEEEDAANKKNQEPSAESLAKLEQLKPLPPLLNDFDFPAHVGLIEKLLAEDKALVDMQSRLSGGGPRERVFWRNYFFHCAYTRYEAGLSLDEIWNEEYELPAQPEAVPVENTTTEETITFDDAPEPTVVAKEESSDYEMVDNAEPSENLEEDIDIPLDTGDEVVSGSEDYELDELEAEIARELED